MPVRRPSVPRLKRSGRTPLVAILGRVLGAPIGPEDATLDLVAHHAGDGARHDPP